MNKKLYKSNSDKMISGVCGGLGEHLNIDPTIIRILWAMAFFMYGAGGLVYILAAIIIPKAPEDKDEEVVAEEEVITEDDMKE